METRILLAEASAEEIRRLSSGEVTVPETLDYRTFQPVPNGLFCESVFGQRPGSICLCGRYERLARIGRLCAHCEVAVVAQKLWDEPIGHINLAAPITLPSQTVATCIAVLSPALRPAIRIDAQRMAVSDLNDLYRRVINRNNRLKKLQSIGGIPESVLAHETRLLQQSVEQLLNNSQRPDPLLTSANRPLYSLYDLFRDLARESLETLLGGGKTE